ncbi:MAG: response regulator [Candidatus Latescibacteria bacterium]|jgi:CheY-like chemotaxis protein|nr:response regulator [Candidatus Latescibacterota bacterium]MBT5832761.1 response regulator [Candidatus Latescibacterota bacterium]
MADTAPEPGDFHILVVDDEPAVREILYELITDIGYRVTAAASGQDALQILTQDRADLVITDLMMPNMNGWQLLKLIKQRFSYMPVIVLTGYISEEGEEMLTNGQTDGYLVKPVDRSKLKKTLNNFRLKKKPGRAGDITILDDDPTALSALEHAFTRRGYHVSTFTEPGDALQHIRETGPDLLILDLMLQGIDGFEISKILRDADQTSRLPILILTAAPSKENVLKAIKLDINGFVAKPFDPKAIVERVRKTLETTSGS